MTRKPTGLLVALLLSFAAVGCGEDEAKQKLADADRQIAAQRAAAERDVKAERTAAREEVDAAQAQVDELEAEVRAERRKLREVRRDVSGARRRLSKLRQEITGAKAQIEANTIPGDGTYVVGEDIQPGTYKGTASDQCYWARLTEAGGSDIIDNHIGSGPVVVQVLPSDGALEVNGCGELKRQG